MTINNNLTKFTQYERVDGEDIEVFYEGDLKWDHIERYEGTVTIYGTNEDGLPVTLTWSEEGFEKFKGLIMSL